MKWEVRAACQNKIIETMDISFNNVDSKLRKTLLNTSNISRIIVALLLYTIQKLLAIEISDTRGGHG